jgi:hypothetical protein
VQTRNHHHTGAHNLHHGSRGSGPQAMRCGPEKKRNSQLPGMSMWGRVHGPAPLGLCGARLKTWNVTRTGYPGVSLWHYFSAAHSVQRLPLSTTIHRNYFISFSVHTSPSLTYLELKRSHFTSYGHRTLKTRLPVRSALVKQCIARLVLWWVTTWESLVL